MLDRRCQACAYICLHINHLLTNMIGCERSTVVLNVFFRTCGCQAETSLYTCDVRDLNL